MKKDLKIFDFHCHVMETSSLYREGFYEKLSLDNARQVAAFLDDEGAEKLAIPSVTLFNSLDLPSNPLTLFAKTLAPEKIFALAGLRRTLDREGNLGMADQARLLLAAGFDGFKMICKPNVRRKFRFAINDPLFDEFFAEAEKNSWPILFHVGDPITFWNRNEVSDWIVEQGWYYGDDKLPSLKQLYDEVFDVLKRYPRLCVTFAHFFFMADHLDKVRELFSAYPNVRFDVTPGGEMYASFSRQREESRALFTDCAGRFLFGTDNAGRSENRAERLRGGFNHIKTIRRFFETGDAFEGFGFPLRGLDLDEGPLKELYSGAFTRVLGEKPAPVNREAAAFLCREYRRFVKEDGPHADETLRLLEELEHVFTDR
ncbi:hypothetical protein FACS1894163_11600 [Spirochaetia bacterium]|nr:hypothetical protein FACS1894163_11600 [Spirochaetia bacterium]